MDYIGSFEKRALDPRPWNFAHHYDVVPFQRSTLFLEIAVYHFTVFRAQVMSECGFQIVLFYISYYSTFYLTTQPRQLHS